jgi:hypothetical protein
MGKSDLCVWLDSIQPVSYFILWLGVAPAERQISWFRGDKERGCPAGAFVG